MCPWCDSVVDVTSRHVAVVAGGVRTYCSADCLAAAQSGSARVEVTSTVAIPGPRRRRVLVLGVGLGLAGLVAVRYGGAGEPPAVPRPAALPVLDASVAEALVPIARPEEEWVAELAKDAWIHPLRGSRRMPRGHGSVFGAERPGDRPIECVSGHCGVDLGGEQWGEPIVAVHDGVIDRVQRGPNDDHGGAYVRIAHRNATVYTQYFHLAAIPRWVTVGTPVKLGQVIGLLGDTGVKRSGAHLHFTISVKASPERTERYIDPEPLIALWPLLVPDEHEDVSTTASMSLGVPPGVPRRGEGPRQKQKRKKKQASADAETTEPTAAVSDERAAPPSTPPVELPPGPATF